MGKRLGHSMTSVSNVTNDLVPDFPSVRDIGSLGTPFKNIYVDNQVVTDDIIFTNPLTGVANNISSLVAVGTTQTDAAPIITTIARVISVNSVRGVKLPALSAVPVGFAIEVMNTSATATLNVYSNAAGETINLVAGTTAFVVPAGTTISFIKFNVSTWLSTGATQTADRYFGGNLIFGTLKGTASNTGTLAALGTTQTDAASIITSLSILTGTTAANGVKLPAIASVPIGFRIVVINSGDSISRVYSNAAGDLINGVAGTTAQIIPGSAEVVYTKFDATNWYSSIATLTVDRVFQGNISLSALKGISRAVGTLAAAGTTQADAAAVVTTVTQVTGAATTNGVRLPALASIADGVMLKVINASTTLPMNVYSNAVGELISGQGGTTAIVLAAKLVLTLTRYNATNWYAEKSVLPY